MDWSQQIDGYCERLHPGLWAEPINALTNIAFLIAALILARRTKGHRSAQILCGILFCIGVGSFLFHTFATPWAALTDVVPIGLFILFYLYVVNKDIMHWPLWLAVLGTAAFLPYASLVVLIFRQIPFLSISTFYWTVPILLLIYAVFIRTRRPAVARGFVIGAGILSLSIVLRSLDEMLCHHLHIGTHFLWHCLNGLMLGYMIHVYHAHVLAGRAHQR